MMPSPFSDDEVGRRAEALVKCCNHAYIAGLKEALEIVQKRLDNSRTLTAPPGMHHTVSGFELARNAIVARIKELEEGK